MCRALLALDPHYTDVRPRHPSGGPDGGRDIEAIYGGDRQVFGAVGFVNGANDSEEQRRQMRRKFSSDLLAATTASAKLKGFVFLTNLHFTMGEQDEMRREAKTASVEHCDVLDRERLRIELDAPGGFFVRYQHLGIPMSDAEQASFLSKYGTQIQEVVSTGFQKVEKTLDRLLFLTEAADVLDTLSFRFVLKRPYLAGEIGHFRTFVFLTLREFRSDMAILWFGASDRSDRFRDDIGGDRCASKSGVGNGISGGQWEQHLSRSAAWAAEDAEREEDLESTNAKVAEAERRSYEQTSWMSGRGEDPVQTLFANYRHGHSRADKRPVLTLRELDHGMFLPFVNGSLADKIHSIQIFANGYKLMDIGPSDFSVDRNRCAGGLPGDFSDEELADAWVRLRPANFNSAYTFRFGDTTPRRIYGHDQPGDSPPPPELT